jgi:hypothetical protein
MEEYVNAPLKSKCKKINIRSRTLACGNVVVKTDGYLEDVISNLDEETEGVEMESFGVVRTTELLEVNEHQAVTKCINHWASSANFKGVTLNEICSGLTGKCSEMPNASYTNRWASF